MRVPRARATGQADSMAPSHRASGRPQQVVRDHLRAEIERLKRERDAGKQGP